MSRYGLMHRLLHWSIAIIIFGLLGSGMAFMLLEFEGTLAAFGKDATDFLYTHHKSFGVLLLILMLVRLALRAIAGAPTYEPPLARWERYASGAVHASLYGLLLLQPVLGWAATASGDYPVQFFAWTLPGLFPKNEALSERLFQVHGLVGWLIIAFLVLHIGAAMRHWLIKRDAVMARIALP